MKFNKKSAYVIASVLLSSILMTFVDGIISPPYLYKSIIKVVLFLIVPMIYFLLNHDEIKRLKKLFAPRKKDFLISLFLGVGVFAVIMAAYFVCRGFIDFSGIRDSLTSGIGVNADNFIFVALYISFCNSLLEEFFFRGFAFLILKEEAGGMLAYIFSSALFAFYHVGMTSGWFGGVIYVLAMLGLFVGGCIFDWLNDKCENIYPSWLVHMCANFAINTIGCILFGII